MGFLVLGVLITLFIMYSNHLFFLVESYRLKKHVVKLAPIYQNSQLQAEPSFCSLQPYSKVWAHRVNTLERFLFLSSHFQGFEMDIMFDERGNFLDVRHPPATSIHLSFERYLQAAESKGKFFWLDVKNLTDSNEASVLNCFMRLNNRYRIQQRIIVESDNIIALSKISDAGYFTSYYYNWNSYNNFVNNNNEAFRNTVLKKIDAVSQDVLLYDTLLNRFPLKPRLTWALSIKNYWSDSLFTSLDHDKQLLVYLVNIRSPHYR